MLPPDIQDALDDYDRRVANGELRFSGEFADEPPESTQWERDFLRSHLPPIELGSGELRNRTAWPHRARAVPPIDEAIAALEKARDLPEFQRLTAYQQILNAYRLSGG